MRSAVRIVMVCALALLPGLLIASEKFDGKWLTKMTARRKEKPRDAPGSFPAR